MTGVTARPAPADGTEPITESKRRLIEHLKRGAATAPELAEAFGLTDTAVRQHLDALESAGLVAKRSVEPAGRGRPAVRWSLTEATRGVFPDRHGDLTVELITSIREALGERALSKVIDTRAAHQLRMYRAELDRLSSVRVKVRRLAELRTNEGYMAEAHADGDGWLLVEHHCPVCAAATSCQNLCRSELEVFQTALGADTVVTREQHLLSGDERCAYRIRPRRAR